MSANVTSIHDNYFSAGLDAYIGDDAVVAISASNATKDYSTGATAASKAVIPVRRSNLGFTYDTGILIPYFNVGADYTFFPFITVATITADFKLKFTARIKILKASYDASPVSMTVGIGLAANNGEFVDVDKTMLIHSDEGWVDLTIIGLDNFSAAADLIINCKLGQFDQNPDCLLLCDNWNAEIFDD